MSETSRAERGWRRWRLAELNEGHRPTASADGESQADGDFDRQAELRALRERVREQAWREGRQAGFEAGHREGLAQGLEQGRREGEQDTARQRAQILAPLAELARGFRDALDSLDEHVAEQLVELALATGRQLAGEALRARPRQVLTIVRELLHDQPGLNGDTRLWLHPRDLALVEKELGAELAAAGWQPQADDQLQRGGCRVTHPGGELDASWESRWAAVTSRVRRRRPAAARKEDPA